MKISQVYNLDSFRPFIDAKFRDEVYSGVTVARTLTHLDPKIFEKKYPELAFITSGIDVDNSGGFANYVESLRISELGDFGIAADNTEKPKISLTGEHSMIPVYQWEAHSKWTDTEVKQAEMSGVSLISNLMTAHNKLYMCKIDEIGYMGYKQHYGLLNYSGFDSDTATGAIGTLNAQQMYDEFATLITTQWASVNNIPEYMANRVDMPIRVFNALNATILNSANGAFTVMQSLRMNFPSVEFRATYRAEGIANGGTLAQSTVIAYSNSADGMKMRIPRPLEIGEIVNIRSWDYVVDSRFRLAGLDIFENATGRYLTGL